MTATAEPKTELKNGWVVAIFGPVVDVEFPPDALPEINFALEMDIELEGEKITVTAEVAQQIGEGRCRAVCLKPTDGLQRGTPVRNLGHGIQVPVGEGTLGHVWNVIGEPLDIPESEVTNIAERWTSTARAVRSARAKALMFETVSRSSTCSPYVQGGKIGLWWRGVGKTVLIRK
jgi:F-type H+-transporting ATPase subunit beta